MKNEYVVIKGAKVQNRCSKKIKIKFKLMYATSKVV